MNSNRHWVAAVTGALLLALAGCASIEPTSALEKARADVNAAATNPDVVSRAPLELRAAEEALDRANTVWRKRESTAEVNHQAYLAQARAAAAIDLARARRATDEMQRAQTESDRVRLAARTREAEAAQAQAALQTLAARDARAQAEAANREASAANREASLAVQQASIDRSRPAQAEAEAMYAKQRLALIETRIVEIEGKHTERGILVTLGDVLFEFNKADLLATAQPRLDKLAEFLRQFPEKKLLIEGYTDAIGSDRYHLELSQRPAEAGQGALVRRGIEPAPLIVEGYG